MVASKGTASWIDEEGAYTESDDSFGQVSIGAYKLGTMIKVSEELLMREGLGPKRRKPSLPGMVPESRWESLLPLVVRKPV